VYNLLLYTETATKGKEEAGEGTYTHMQKPEGKTTRRHSLVALSLADTCTIPLASISKLTCTQIFCVLQDPGDGGTAVVEA
jgi:hypothetical protein